MQQDIKHLQRRYSSLDLEYGSWYSHHKELVEYMLPRVSRFFTTERGTGGQKKNTKLAESTAAMALRVMVAGFMSGMTNPSRVWHRLRVADPDLNKFHPVKEWLEESRRRVAEAMLRSNLYTTLPQTYTNLGLVGTDAFAIQPDHRTGFRCYSLPIGSYRLGTDHRGFVDTVYRKVEMSVSQLVGQFGRDKCSPGVQSMWDRGNYDVFRPVVHAVEPNFERNPKALSSGASMQWLSCYYEEGEQKELRRKGFERMPVIASRWSVIGEDVYGDSPGMMALADVKQLQLMQRRKLELIEKNLRPPLVAPSGMKRRKISLIPSDITYADTPAGGQKVEPLFMPTLSLADLTQEIGITQERIRKVFFADLFLMFAELERGGLTATEVLERKAEKLLGLGPVYLRLNDELFDPLVEWVFWHMFDSGQLPPPPPELEGQEIAVEYISILSQAMRAVGLESLERSSAYLGTIAQASPTVLDNYNFDAMAREHSEMLGLSPHLMFSPEAVKYSRDKTAQQVAMQQSMEMAGQGAQVAKTLSETQLGDNNALAQLMQRMPPASAIQSNSPIQGVAV